MSDRISIFNLIMSFFGFCLFFKKCGVKVWYGLIPGYREYKLGEIGQRKTEGRNYLIYSIISTILTFAVSVSSAIDKQNGMEDYGTMTSFFSLLYLIIAVPVLVYGIRIYIGVCERFGKSKWWLILWIFLDWAVMIFWSLRKDYKVSIIDISEDIPDSDITSTGSGKELTINITDRTVKSLTSKRTLLKDIHLKIEPGHMVLLLGGSGAGKTTFLNAITGYEKANAEIELGSENIYKNYNQLKHRIGFVPQQDLMRGSDTVYRTLADAAALRMPKSVPAAERKKRIDDVLDLFGLGMLKTSLVDKLSGGQRKRLSIAMEYISDPKLFILDEPDSGLDGVVAKALFKKLREIANQGRIVIVITHTPNRVADMFDDVIVLAKDHDRTGRLTYFGSVKDAFGFFEKDSFESILTAINQKEEGGEGRAEELVKKYNSLMHLNSVGGERA